MLVLFGVEKKINTLILKRTWHNFTHTQWHLLYVSLQTEKLSCGCHVFLYAFKIRSVFYHFSIWCIKQQHAIFTFWSLFAWIHINKWGIIQHAVCMWSLVSQSPWVVAWAPTAQIRLVCHFIYKHTLADIYQSQTLILSFTHTSILFGTKIK